MYSKCIFSQNLSVKFIGVLVECVLDANKVTFGNNVVIGGGSVVVKDIQDNSVAVGNPCKVIRAITEDDKKKCWNRG